MTSLSQGVDLERLPKLARGFVRPNETLIRYVKCVNAHLMLTTLRLMCVRSNIGGAKEDLYFSITHGAFQASRIRTRGVRLRGLVGGLLGLGLALAMFLVVDGATARLVLAGIPLAAAAWLLIDALFIYPRELKAEFLTSSGKFAVALGRGELLELEQVLRVLEDIAPALARGEEPSFELPADDVAPDVESVAADPEPGEDIKA